MNVIGKILCNIGKHKWTQVGDTSRMQGYAVRVSQCSRCSHILLQVYDCKHMPWFDNIPTIEKEMEDTINSKYKDDCIVFEFY